MEKTKITLSVDSGQMSVVPIFSGYEVSDEIGIGVFPVDPGTVWFCYVKLVPITDWGTRVANLVVSTNLVPVGYKFVGSFLCEADKLIISDPCYLTKDMHKDKGPYYRACETTNNGFANIFTHVSGPGVCSRSGFGDGEYSAVVFRENGKMIGVEIDFDVKEEDQ